MTDAPERIWIEDERPHGGICFVHSEGDAGRNAIAADGGDKARAALSKLEKVAACPP